MGLFSKKKSEVAQDTNTNLQKIKDDIEEEIEDLESKIKEKNERKNFVLPHSTLYWLNQYED